MRRLVGIDEAGYGPNLGPFVMTAVACRVAEGPEEIDLWDMLSAVAARRADAKDGRLMIDDSKLVHEAGKGLEVLETGVLVPLRWAEASLKDLLHRVAPTSCEDLLRECWYRGDSAIPSDTEAEELQRKRHTFHEACESEGVTWLEARSVVICPPRFNALIEHHNSKGGNMAYALRELLVHQQEIEGERESIEVHVDKHGGRNAYSPMLQEAFADHWVWVERESALLSRYRVDRPQGTMRISFLPRADRAHFLVALASMVSKYLRELFMREFNRLWREHLPDLKPTAGYPSDAARFMEAIRPVVARLGLEEGAIWRTR